MSNQDKLDPQIQKILDHTPRIMNAPHVFFSAEADLKMGGRKTVQISDEFGHSARINFIGACAMDDNGAVIPDDSKKKLDAPASTYFYLGYLDGTGTLIHSDHTPERPRFFRNKENDASKVCLPAPEQPQTDPQQDHNPQP